MRDFGLAPNTIASYVRILKSFLSWCNEEGITQLNIKLYKGEETIKETYSDAELALLLKKPDLRKCSFVEYRCWVITNFLLNSGSRAATIRAIQIRDVDLENSIGATYTNGVYAGNIYNGTGYYGFAGGNLTVTLGENAVLNGDIALTSTIKGVPYSKAAMDGIAYYGNDIGYVLLDAGGKETANEAEAAFIQTRSYTITQNFLQGHVENMLHYNGVSTIAVVVESGAAWNVAGESLITKLSIAEGASVKGVLTVNEDGTLTLTAGDALIPAGEYGTIEPAAAAASGEASGSASGEASGGASGGAS